jgi:hypothetical protein
MSTEPITEAEKFNAQTKPFCWLRAVRPKMRDGIKTNFTSF